ncbi:hypothetical protein FRC12_000803 [Ceratobasidium sp. 428]|nr:hypothetical protein FRC12_000803 [Ceratobasidium sp. 428]
MPDQSRPKKKQKFEPPSLPRPTAGMTTALGVDHPGPQSTVGAAAGIAAFSVAAPEVTSSGDVVAFDRFGRTSSTYLMSAQTAQQVNTFGPGIANVTFSTMNPQAIAPQPSESDKYGSEDEAGVEGDESSNEHEDNEDGESGEKCDSDEAGGNVIEVEIPKSIKTQAELDDFIFQVRANYLKNGQLPPKAKTKASAPPSQPVVPQLGPDPLLNGKSKEVVVTVEKGPGVQAETVDGDLRRDILCAHTLKSLLSMCGLKYAHQATQLIPQYDEVTREPRYMIGKRLIPHFDRSFTENFDEGWGEEYYGVVTNPSLMKTNKEYLTTVPREVFRNVLSGAGFATMRDAWNRNKEGKGEEAREKKNRRTRRALRKSAKSDRRKKALGESELELGSFEFLVDPGFQSSEHSDVDDTTLCVVQEPAFRANQVNQLLDALDVGFTSGKQKAGNRQFTKIQHRVVNIPVPRLKKTASKVPSWAIDSEWGKNQPAVERISRPHINFRATQMPQGPTVDQFLYEYEPDPRDYVLAESPADHGSAPASAAAAATLASARSRPPPARAPVVSPVELAPAPAPTAVPAPASEPTLRSKVEPKSAPALTTPQPKRDPEPAPAATRKRKKSRRLIEAEEANDLESTKEVEVTNAKGKGRKQVGSRQESSHMMEVEVRVEAQGEMSVAGPSQGSWSKSGTSTVIRFAHVPRR